MPIIKYHFNKETIGGHEFKVIVIFFLSFLPQMRRYSWRNQHATVYHFVFALALVESYMLLQLEHNIHTSLFTHVWFVIWLWEISIF